VYVAAAVATAWHCRLQLLYYINQRWCNAVGERGYAAAAALQYGG